MPLKRMLLMNGKPMLSIERELIQRIADHCKFWVDNPYLEAIADVEVELRSILDNPACIKCNDTGEADSGGAQPWGEGINIPCDCELPDHQHGKPVAWVNDQQLLLCSQSPREIWPENPMIHNLPRNIAGSALRTDYCNTPLFAGKTDSEACTSCDGSGEYIDAIGDWRGYCECQAGVVAKNRTYPPAPSSAELDIESAAKKLSECMDYPWQHMTDQGRQSMRDFAKLVIEAGAGVKP